jgi:hypothetical protein
MKKQKAMRKYTLTDAELILKGKEKISFFRRDKDAFAVFGITETMIAELETDLTVFSNSVTDIEAKNKQMGATQIKNAKAAELRTAIKNVMKRVEFVFGVNTARYKQFDTKAMRQKSDSDLLITAKVVVQAGTIHLQEFARTGLTAAMLNAIMVLCEELEELIHELKDSIWERSYHQENRITAGNMLYAKLVKYASVGFRIWETTSAAKYNDYIIYGRAV